MARLLCLDGILAMLVLCILDSAIIFEIGLFSTTQESDRTGYNWLCAIDQEHWFEWRFGLTEPWSPQSQGLVVDRIALTSHLTPTIYQTKSSLTQENKLPNKK